MKTNYINLAKAFGQIGMYMAQALAIKFRERDPVARRRKMIENITAVATGALERFQIRVEVVGKDPVRLRRPHLVISNHLSYLDIIMLAYSEPMVFVTSVDMGQTPGLGQIAEFGGSLFIERRNRSRIEKDMQNLVETIQHGFHVAVFPEGTSSNGQDVLPFKKSLFEVATRAGVDIQPICIKYTQVDGQPFSRENHHKVCWYGDMDFLSHFKDVCTTPNKRAEIHYLPPIQVKHDMDRRELAELTYQAIRSEYHRK